MKLAFYVASKGRFLDKAINFFSGRYGYSHTEMIFSDGMSFSSSPREGSVRFKNITFDEGKWVFLELPYTEKEEANLRDQANDYLGAEYDYIGIFLNQLLGLRFNDPDKWWCSEIHAYILGMYDYTLSPNELAKSFKLPDARTAINQIKTYVQS